MRHPPGRTSSVRNLGCDLDTVLDDLRDVVRGEDVGDSGEEGDFGKVDAGADTVTEASESQ